MTKIYSRRFLFWLLCLFSSFMTIHGNAYANYSGDIYLAAFFPIHGLKVNSASDGRYFYTPHKNMDVYELYNMVDTLFVSDCGPIQEEDGIQALEAFFHALDEVNAREDLLPGFKLGALTFDSCEDEKHALEQAISLIQVLITKGHATDILFECSDGSRPQLIPEAEDFSKIVGVVGGSSSDVSIALASLLRLFGLPQVSYLATSPDLSNKERYPFFLRTVPSDITQARAIVEVLKEFNWTYVSVLYDNSNYGNKGFIELENAAAAAGICFAYSRTINYATWVDQDYDNVILDLARKPQAKAVVLWAVYSQAREIFAAAQRMNLSQEITWVGSDGWSGRMSAVIGLETVAEGAITVQPLAFKLPDFDSYFTSLKPDNNPRNPWFEEFWENHFNCILPGVINRDKFGAEDHLHQSLCTGEEEVGPDNGYVQSSYLHFIHDTVSVYAHALTKMHSEICGGQGLCEAMHPNNISGPQLFSYLANATFNSTSGRNFTFYNDIDGPPRYTLLNLQLAPGQKPNHSWDYVGEYSAFPGEDDIYIEPEFVNTTDSYPSSICSKPCELGYAKAVSPGDRCCWICTRCADHQYVIPDQENLVCVDCALGEWPDEQRNSCFPIQAVHMSHTDQIAIGAMVYSFVAVLVSFGVLIIFLVYNGTPVIKASSREVSLVLLGGIFLSYLSTFVFVSPPNDGICGSTRVLLGICYTVVYASILTKTSRIARIFKDTNGSPKKARYTSPKAQLFIVGIIVLVEVVILAAWIVVAPPSVKNHYPSPAENVLVCSGAEDSTYVIALAYPFLLLILCTVYAFKTRKTPDGFKETRLIGFTCYTTCIIWVTFVPTYLLNQNYIVRSLALCLSVSVNATVALLVLFGPKVYICLFRPNKNTREAVMTRSGSMVSGSAAVPSVDRKPSFLGSGSVRDLVNIKERMSKGTPSETVPTANMGQQKIGNTLEVPKPLNKPSPLTIGTTDMSSKNKHSEKERISDALDSTTQGPREVMHSSEEDKPSGEDLNQNHVNGSHDTDHVILSDRENPGQVEL